MKNQIGILIIVVLLAIFFTACGTRHIDESDLCEWIEEHPDFLKRDGQFAQINEIEVLRRQTEQDMDLFWVTVFASLGEIDFALSYHLYFGQYNNEWHLRQFESYHGVDGSWEQSFLSEEEVLAIAGDSFLGLDALEGLSIESIMLSVPMEEHISAWSEYLWLEFNLVANSDIAQFDKILSLDFFSTAQGWIPGSASVLHRWATPLQEIEQQTIDFVVH